jgi:hypothetical protein
VADKDRELKIIITKSTDTYTRSFYENGIITATQTFSTAGVFISSSGFIRDGIYYEYDENSNMTSERTLKDGIENGPVIEFYPDGIIKSRIDFKDGKTNGKAFYYTPDSKLILEQTYSNGLLDGFSVEYDSDGNIKSKVLYSNGELANDIVKPKEEVIKSSAPVTTDIKVATDTAVEQPKPVEKKIVKSDEFSSRVIKIARGEKIFIYRNNKYIGSFTIDDDYNIIDVTGNIPDRDYEIKDKTVKLVFTIQNDSPQKLSVFRDGSAEDDYIYSDFKALKK